MIEIDGYFWPDSIRQKDVDWQFKYRRGALAVLPFVKSKEAMIQAGGCVGVYPIEQSKVFKQVFTFEADQENFDCLCRNMERHGSKDCTVWHFNQALSNRNGKAKFEQRRYATHRLHPSGSSTVSLVTVDKMMATCQNPVVSAMQIDVEGGELKVLQGAAKTIEAHKPVIQLESLVSDDGKAEEFLMDYGYKLVHKIDLDKIYVCQ